MFSFAIKYVCDRVIPHGPVSPEVTCWYHPSAQWIGQGSASWAHGEEVAKTAPLGPAFCIWVLLVGLDPSCAVGEVRTVAFIHGFVNGGACCIAYVSDCDDIEVQPAVIDASYLLWLEFAVLKHNVHDILVALSLERW